MRQRGCVWSAARTQSIHLWTTYSRSRGDPKKKKKELALLADSVLPGSRVSENRASVMCVPITKKKKKKEPQLRCFCDWWEKNFWLWNFKRLPVVVHQMDSLFATSGPYSFHLTSRKNAKQHVMAGKVSYFYPALKMSPSLGWKVTL